MSHNVLRVYIYKLVNNKSKVLSPIIQHFVSKLVNSMQKKNSWALRRLTH